MISRRHLLSSLLPTSSIAATQTSFRPFVVNPRAGGKRRLEVAASAFPLRGMKGWAWSPAQYLQEIPVLAKCRMNFLMNCYSSLWELGSGGAWVKDRPMNFWYKPMREERKRGLEEVVRSCGKHAIDFCFSLNPNLMSDRPFDYDSQEDFEVLWNSFAWMQRLGVKWFNVSFDDIQQRIDAAGQARILNRLLERLRREDRSARLVFCPTWYAGTGDAEKESPHRLGRGDTPGQRYTRVLAGELHSDIFVFWTGPEVCPLQVTCDDARKYAALVRHKLILWDNYPVNDQTPALHLAPLSGRDPRLPETVEGYMGNPMSFEIEANRIPMLTLADYAANPLGYDSSRSIAWAIAELSSGPQQSRALTRLVELYPGRLWDGSQSTTWNSLRERIRIELKTGRRAEARVLIERASEVEHLLASAFPGRHEPTRRQLRLDTDTLRAELER